MFEYKEGQRVPQVTFRTRTADDWQDLTSDEREVLRASFTPPKWRGECLGCGRTFTRRRVNSETLRFGSHGGGCGGRIRFTDQRTGRTYETIDRTNPFGW